MSIKSSSSSPGEFEPAAPDQVVAGVIEGFQAGSLPSYAHYLTARQTQLWHELAKGFQSRASGDSAFDQVFAKTAQLCNSSEVQVIAIGAGVAEKELRLVRALRRNQAQCIVTFVDISPNLLSQAEATFSTEHDVTLQPPFVADISAPDFSMSPRQANARTDSLQIFTLFGVVPGLTSKVSPSKIINELNPGDLFLFSLNLLPESEAEAQAPHSLESLASFYDSAAARAWLKEILHIVGLDPATVTWRVAAESSTNDLQAVATVSARITTQAPTQIRWQAKKRTVPANHQVEVFRSHRHTSKSAAALVQDLGLELVDWQVSQSGEEGVALTRLPV